MLLKEELVIIMSNISSFFVKKESRYFRKKQCRKTYDSNKPVITIKGIQQYKKILTRCCISLKLTKHGFVTIRLRPTLKCIQINNALMKLFKFFKNKMKS